MDNTYESVHHARKTSDKVVNREAYDYVPRYAQGSLIERMKVHASTEITREDFSTMNCAVFTNLLDVCSFIEETEKIGYDRAYPALCDIGRDRCYHEFKRNGERDVFSDIADLISTGRKSIDNKSKRSAARCHISIFDDVRSAKFRTTKQTVAIAVEHSKDRGIKTSHMNLYYTLVGLKYLTENEADYILLSEKILFRDTLYQLVKANETLNERRKLLQSVMTI